MTVLTATDGTKQIPFEVAEIELTYKSTVYPSEMAHIDSAFSAYGLFINQWSNQLELREEFNVIFLNRANKAIGFYNASTGGTAGTVVDTKLIFTAALKCKASSIILAHNHPSGKLYPSDTDKVLTHKLVQAGKFLELPVLDHLIITVDGYYSFADEKEI